VVDAGSQQSSQASANISKSIKHLQQELNSGSRFFDKLDASHYRMRGGETVRKIQTRILSVITIILVGITMFSMANATTPEENKAAGEAFLAENAKKPNIITTASGLQYEILKKGEGATPSATDNVTVHYKGTTIDGNEFDSSYSRGEPATFPLNRVIPGWTEGVQLMQEGAKYRFYIPSDLAYGAHGAGRLIGPNSTLIFDVELINIQ
jgi:FKBP-type peptidyl-prolyl cis-trans isomerase FkpA